MEKKQTERIRPPYGLRFLLAVLLATLIYLEIFFTAYIISYINYQGVSQGNNFISESIEYINNVIQQGECSSDLLIESSEKLDRVGAKLGILEKRLGKNDPRILEQKKLYSDLEIKHWGLIKKINNECEGNFATILFFYSNIDEKQDESEKMGLIIGSFKRAHIENVMVYSFDYDLKYIPISNLKEQYNIQNAPRVLINEETNAYISNINELNNIVVDSNKE